MERSEVIYIWCTIAVGANRAAITQSEPAEEYEVGKRAG